MKFLSSKKILFTIFMLTAAKPCAYGMDFVEEADITVPEVYAIRDNYDGIIPAIDNLNPQQVILGANGINAKRQGGSLELEANEAITGQRFRDLWREKAAAGLPLLVCRVTTATPDKNNMHKHFFSTSILHWFYGQDFPEIVKGAGKTNPLNQLKPIGEIDIYLAKLGEDNTIPYVRLGSDVDVIRDPSGRISNILRLADPERKELLLDGAEALIHDADPYIQSTALLHNALKWIAQGKSEECSADVRKGMKRLEEAINIDGCNPYARVLAIYEYSKVLNRLDLVPSPGAQRQAVDQGILRSSLTTNLEVLVRQKHNTLLRDRALTLLVCIENSVDFHKLSLEELEKLKDRTEKSLKHVHTSNKSPKKASFAGLMLASHHSLTSEDSIKYLTTAAHPLLGNSPFASRARYLLNDSLYNEESGRQLSLLKEGDDSDDEEAIPTNAESSYAAARRLLFN